MPKEYNIAYIDALDNNRLAQLAKLYARVFAPPPWNEAVKCNGCQQFEGLSTPLESSCGCGGAFKEAYPLDETQDYIRQDSLKPAFRLAAINSGSEVSGFAWSYSTTPSKLVQDKWSQEIVRQNILTIFSNLGIEPSAGIRYFSECGIDPPLRGQGLSTQLTDLMIDRQMPTIYRTNCQSPMMAVANRLGYQQIMGPAVIINRDAKTITETGGVVNLLDDQNPQRTLFIKFP